ncbi:Actin-related protein 10 [Smittium mucronatum]|uniref:Actin-related protein 10 n=1 Tax=Smittium mucronatum TaxID=133383 RepID=A0A1R0H4U3_9FUNG|nr:Actin-related protein 10 [Smittium mucronatum]
MASFLDSDYYKRLLSSTAFQTTPLKLIFEVSPESVKSGFSGDYFPKYCNPLGRKFDVIPFGFSEEAFRIKLNEDVLYQIPLEIEELTSAKNILVYEFRKIYEKKLLVDPRTNKVVIVEPSPLLIPIKYLLVKVLLEDMLVPSITFFPGSVMSLLTLGKMEGLVIHFGSIETTITPVFDFRPLESLSISSSLGKEKLRVHLRDQLIKHGHYINLSSESNTDQTKQKFTPLILTNELCQHIIENLVFASPLSPPKNLVSGELSSNGTVCGIRSDSLAVWCQQSSIATDLYFSWSHQNKTKIKCFLPGFVREHVLDILFCGDSENDISGVVDLTFQVIKNLPVDLKKRLSSKILVIGDLAEIPNFQNRFMSDLMTRLINDPKCEPLSRTASLLDDNSHTFNQDFNTPDINNKSDSDAFEDQGQAHDSKNTNKETEKMYSNSGSTFKSSDRCWVGSSIAVSSKIEGFELNLENYQDFFKGLLSA